MAVFTWRTMDEIRSGVRKLANRLITGHNLTLTPDEFIASFIDPEHVPVLKTTAQIVGHVGEDTARIKLSTVGGLKLECSLMFGGSMPPIILPHYIAQGPRSTAPAEVTDKINAWLEERVRLGRFFGDAIDALSWLNDNCGNANAMAVMFPALPTILRTYDSDPDSMATKRAVKMTNAKSFGSLPKLPREVKARFIECSDLLLAVSMLEGDAERKVKRHHAFIYNAHLAAGSRLDHVVYTALGQTADASFV